MTELRKRMIEDMKLHGFSQRTQESYLHSVCRLARHFNKSPERITNQELREYLLYHKERYARNTTTIALCGIKFFYEKPLQKQMPVFNITRLPRGKQAAGGADQRRSMESFAKHSGAQTPGLPYSDLFPWAEAKRGYPAKSEPDRRQTHVDSYPTSQRSS